MIAPRTARQRVARHCRPLGAHAVPLADALGCVLAEDVRARAPLPGFDNSAMDGFAIRSRDVMHARASHPVHLTIRGTIAAGDGKRHVLRQGEAFRIMTGAPLPSGADAVVPLEEVAVAGSAVTVSGSAPHGRFVRYRGEEIAARTRLLTRGTVLSPAAVGILATVGAGSVRVVRRPSVWVIATGDELVAPPASGAGRPGRAPLGRGRVYDSASVMGAAMVERAGFDVAGVSRVADRPAAIARAVDRALAGADVVVAIGGVSVGARDFVRGAFDERGVRTVFWRVRQKPGKPLFFGVLGRQLAFGLPGNPASAFSCFTLYVIPALRRLGGFPEAGPRRRVRVLERAVVPDTERWAYLKARASGDNTVRALQHQGSHMITSLVDADCLIEIPAAHTPVPAGSEVVTFDIPGREVDA